MEERVALANYRAMDVESMLIEYSIEFASQKACKRMTLLADLAKEGAYRCHGKHGFSRSSMQTFRRLLLASDDACSIG